MASCPADIPPVQFPHNASVIVLFGGSFDPPHVWHTAILAAAMLTADPSGKGFGLVVPAALSPLKAAVPSASDAHRAAMARLALDDAVIARSAVWTDELDRVRREHAVGEHTKSYTINTLHRLRRIAPQHLPIRLLIGADQAGAFHRWREFRTLFAEATPLVALRPPIDSAQKLRALLDASGTWTRTEIDAWAGLIVPMATSEVSSTQVRGTLSQDSPSNSARPAASLSPGVLRYIREHGLYGHETNR